jgi:hypothetical protein
MIAVRVRHAGIVRPTAEAGGEARRVKVGAAQAVGPVPREASGSKAGVASVQAAPIGDTAANLVNGAKPLHLCPKSISL